MQKIPGEIKLSPFFVVYFNWHYTLFLFALRRLLVGVIHKDLGDTGGLTYAEGVAEQIDLSG